MVPSDSIRLSTIALGPILGRNIHPLRDKISKLPVAADSDIPAPWHGGCYGYMMVTSTYSFLGHTSGQSAIKVLLVSSQVDPRGSMNGEIQGISRVCVFPNPFTCHLLCSEGNNGVGVGGLRVLGGWDMQETGDVYFAGAASEPNGCCPRVLAAGASPTPNHRNS